jgi:hypothetical protein
MVSGPGIRKSVGDGYCVLKSKIPRRSIGTGAGPHPWEIELASGGLFKTHPGTINGLLPGNMFDQLTFPTSGTAYHVLGVDSDGDTPTNAVIGMMDSPPPAIPSNIEVAPESFTLLLNVIVDTSVFEIITTNIYAQPVITILSLSASPTPGQPFFDLNYTWRVM